LINLAAVKYDDLDDAKRISRGFMRWRENLSTFEESFRDSPILREHYAALKYLVHAVQVMDGAIARTIDEVATAQEPEEVFSDRR